MAAMPLAGHHPRAGGGDAVQSSSSSSLRRLGGREEPRNAVARDARGAGFFPADDTRDVAADVHRPVAVLADRCNITTTAMRLAAMRERVRLRSRSIAEAATAMDNGNVEHASNSVGSTHVPDPGVGATAECGPPDRKKPRIVPCTAVDSALATLSSADLSDTPAAVQGRPAEPEFAGDRRNSCRDGASVSGDSSVRRMRRRLCYKQAG